MKVSLHVKSCMAVDGDDYSDAYYEFAVRVYDADEARAIACRLDREIVVNMPEAQPPMIYEAFVPEEEAEIDKKR